MSVRTMCTNPRHSFDSEVASRPRRRPDDGSALAFGTLFSSQGANPGRVPFLAPALPTKKKPPAREPTASTASGLRDRLRQTPSLSCSIVRKMAPIRILLPGPSQGPVANGTAMARMASTTGHPRHTSQATLAVTSYFDELPPSDLQDLALHVPHVHLEVGVLDLLSIDPDTSLLDLPSPFGV